MSKQLIAKELREISRNLGWFGAQGNLIEPDTAWAGVSACRDVLNKRAEELEREAEKR